MNVHQGELQLQSVGEYRKILQRTGNQGKCETHIWNKSGNIVLNCLRIAEVRGHNTLTTSEEKTTEQEHPVDEQRYPKP
jgi:hypothetical protein